MSPATPVALPLLLLEITAPDLIEKLPATVSVMLPPLPPLVRFSARIELPPCISMSPPTRMVMGEAPVGGRPVSLQVMLPVPVISRSPGTVRSNGQNAVIGVLIVQSPLTSTPPTAAQVNADAWPGIPTARTRAAITTIASESFRVIFPMLLSMSSLLRSVRGSNAKAVPCNTPIRTMSF
jgi:hypothetical protein